MTENRYEKHCPCTVSELREFRKLGEIEGTILEEAAAAKETLERNQWILTAEKSGLLRLAGMMGFFGAEQMETEELREESFRAGAAAVHIPIFICRTGWTGVWVREIIPVHWRGKATDCG